MTFIVNAAARLAAFKHWLALAKQHEVTDDVLDLLIPSIFEHVKPVRHMTQREKVQLHLPFPYAQVYQTSLFGNALFVSLNAVTEELWVCAFLCADTWHPLPDPNVPMKSFRERIQFRDNQSVSDSIQDAYKRVQRRILQWGVSLEEPSWWK